MKKKMKKIAVAALSCLMMLGLIPVTSQTVGAEESEDGEWEYEIINDETIAVIRYNGDEKEITIPETIDGYTVVEIRCDPLYLDYWVSNGFYSVSSITVSNTVTTINNRAFDGCENLNSIVISDSVTYIGEDAFDGCYNLSAIEVDSDNECFSSDDGILYNKSKKILIKCPESKTDITIPDSVICIEDYAFSSCDELINIEIPDSVTEIGEGAFCGCNNLSSINIPYGVINIEKTTFSNCVNLRSIEIPNSVTSIGDSAFYNCDNLSSLEIPGSVINVGNGAFCYCDRLSNITILNGVVSIGNNAFGGCLITDIIIPESVNSIGTGVFNDCSNLTNIEVNINNKNYSSENGIIYNKEKTNLLRCPEGKINVEFSNTVTTIDDYAFSNCVNLRSIEIPNSVTSIGVGSFFECSNLGSIVIPNGVTGIESSTFQYCTNLSNVTIPDSVTYIGGDAFSNCSSLSSIEIPDSVTNIGNSAFNDCSSLSSIEIPDSVTNIGNSAFSNCSSLSSIEIPNSINTIEALTFSGCTNLTSVTIPNNVTVIDYLAFTECKNLSNIIIPDSVKRINSNAFDGCENLTYVEIKNNDINIEDEVFLNCPSLTIYCYTCSEAHYYAFYKGIPFVLLDDTTTDNNSTQEIICTGNTKSSINTSEEDLYKAVFNDKELEQIENGANVSIELKINEISSDTDNTDKLAVETALPSGYKITNYFDITLTSKINETIRQITETSSAIEIAVDIPTETTGTYQVIRLHDGAAEILPTTIKDGKIVFSTDKFSTYAIIYKSALNDVEAGNNGMTVCAVLLAVMSVTAAGVICFRKKKYIEE